MQNDIVPPSNWKNTKVPKNKPMRSLRLQGHSSEDAKNRLAGNKDHTETNTHDFTSHAVNNHAAEISAVINKDKPPRGFKWVIHHLRKRTKFELAALFVVFVGGIGVVTYLMMHKKAPPPPRQNNSPKAVAATKPATVASPLTGVQVAPELAARPVTGIMIENSLDARPQSGMQDAGVVYEAIAEGGITRFLNVFQDSRPQYVGPVRSLRPYYIDFATPYQASVAHVGGSPDALAQIRSGAYRDIDQFFNSGSYWRSNARPAPHNVYTSFDKLDSLNKSKGYNSSTYSPWKRKDDKPLATPTNAHIDVKISSQLYYSHYDYDKATNSYLRSEGGRPHINVTSADDKSGVQLHPKVVLALVMSYSVIDKAGHSGYGTTGSGQLIAFQDGGVTQGTWSKNDRGAMFEFKDAAGQILPLNTGQTWVVAVSSPSQVTATP